MHVCTCECVQVCSHDYSLVNSNWHAFAVLSDLHLYTLAHIYLFRFAGKPSHAFHYVCQSNVISVHTIPIWRYSRTELGMPRPVTACLTCHCVGWCDAMLNQPICSRSSWHMGDLIGGRHEEKGIGPGVWRSMASKNLLNCCPQKVQSMNEGVMECECVCFH